MRSRWASRIEWCTLFKLIWIILWAAGIPAYHFARRSHRPTISRIYKLTSHNQANSVIWCAKIEASTPSFPYMNNEFTKLLQSTQTGDCRAFTRTAFVHWRIKFSDKGKSEFMALVRLCMYCGVYQSHGSVQLKYRFYLSIFTHRHTHTHGQFIHCSNRDAATFSRSYTIHDDTFCHDGCMKMWLCYPIPTTVCVRGRELVYLSRNSHWD